MKTEGLKYTRTAKSYFKINFIARNTRLML